MSFLDNYDELDIQGLYANEWETVFTAESRREAIQVHTDYENNEKGVLFRIRRSEGSKP